MADEVLAQTVNKPLSSPLPTTPTQSLKALQDVAAKESAAIEDLGAAEAKKIKQEPMIKAQLKEAEGKYVSSEQEKKQKDIAEAEYAMSQFKASKDSIGGFAILGSLIGALGMIAGNTGGKQSALNSIKSMTGMMDGYSKGRADEFRRNQIEFDKEFKIMQNKIERANKQFDQALALMPYNTVEAQKVADSAIAELNSDIVSAKYKQQGLVPTKELLAKAYDASQKAADRANQLNVAKSKQSGAGILKPTAKAGEGYISLNILANDLKGLTKDLQNPALQQQIKDNRFEAFLTEEAKFLDQAIGTDLPPELNVFLTKVRDIRNNYYLDISGKAVTGAEALRSYGTVPQPGDSPERMQQKVTGMVDRVDSKIRANQVLYGFPAVALDQFPAGTKTSLTPGENYNEQEKPEIVISNKQQYDALPSNTEYYEIDAQGNKTKFRKP